MRSTQRLAGISFLLLAALLFTLGLSSTAALAQPAPQQAGPGQMISIPAGQTTTIPVRGFCLDFGKPFPGGSTAPTELGPDAARAALNYAISKDYTNSDPRQVQEAIWFLAGNVWHRADHALGQEIVDASKNAVNNPAAPAGTSLLDALKANGVTGTVSFQPPAGTAPADASYGDGTLTLKNTGTQDVQVYLPLGSVFPPANAGDQRLIGYALANTPAAAVTAAATNTQAATVTAAATNTQAATAMPVATDTVAPVATAMPLATAVPTTTSAVGTLPKTGAGSGGFPGWLLLFAASLAALFAGVALLRRDAAAR
ncbi:MAG: hypothetical protein M3021_03530 [Actinomycetota bacterium]|nr:hypothetical protein [Actinomycetota bacterium]